MFEEQERGEEKMGSASTRTRPNRVHQMSRFVSKRKKKTKETKESLERKSKKETIGYE